MDNTDWKKKMARESFKNTIFKGQREEEETFSKGYWEGVSREIRGKQIMCQWSRIKWFQEGKFPWDVQVLLTGQVKYRRKQCPFSLVTWSLESF